MSKSRSGLVGRHPGATTRRGQITMIEPGVLYHAIRRSKIAFWAVGGVCLVVVSVVAAGFTHPVKAVFTGIITGAVAGFIAAFVLFCWPAIRVAWHWAAEFTLLGFFLITYLALLRVTAAWLALSLLVTVGCSQMLVPAIRRRAVALFWCAVSRHRLRLCFAAFVASQRTGLTPLILLARPTPAGERVWVWLRPGLALADLESRLDRLAAGCWAAECRIAPASRRYAALVHIDIARRNPLDTTLGSPLPGLVPTHTLTHAPVSPAIVGGLDLPDIPDTPQTPAAPVEGKRRLKAVTTAAGPELTAVITPTRGVDDLNEWI